MEVLPNDLRDLIEKHGTAIQHHLYRPPAAYLNAKVDLTAGTFSWSSSVELRWQRPHLEIPLPHMGVHKVFWSKPSWSRVLIIFGEIRRGEERRKKKEEVLHLFRCYTHTHTRPEPGQPWKARGRKKRTQTTGKRPKQRRGGRERTDLQNQPTRRNGPDKNRAHT